MPKVGGFMDRDNIDLNTAEKISQWLQDNGFENASKALDAELEL